MFCFALLRSLRIGFRTVVKYRKIPLAAAANQIAENARIPPAADLQKNKICYLKRAKVVEENKRSLFASI
jgi:hypothetical protein